MDAPDLDLAALPDIGHLPADTLDQLQERGRRVRIPAGWTPIHQSEPADKAYLILDGHLDVIRGDHRVASLGPGALAGEMGLVDHRLRNARLTATMPVHVLAWTKGDFTELRTTSPNFDAHVRELTEQRHDDNVTGV